MVGCSVLEINLCCIPLGPGKLSMVAPMNVEDADEDFPPHFQTATGKAF